MNNILSLPQIGNYFSLKLRMRSNFLWGTGSGWGNRSHLTGEHSLFISFCRFDQIWWIVLKRLTAFNSDTHTYTHTHTYVSIATIQWLQPKI